MFRKSTYLSLITLLAFASRSAAQDFPPGVIATGTNGPTNPPAPTQGTPINQTSDARLLTINSIDDFCLFAPPTLETVGNSETYNVAWCTKPRNNARVIPDGTFTGVQFLKTDFYVQVMGFGNLTNLNIPQGDYGGELDPHGAYGYGNPIGGNVTSNAVNGRDERFEEWMQFISFEKFCIRVCTNANSTYSAAAMCEHKLDIMGCEFVMPADYAGIQNKFDSCDADVAYPPGWYPTATVAGVPQYSQFAQRYTGTLTDGQVYTVGVTVTPAGPYSTPASSNCRPTSTIANGIPLASLGLAAAETSSSARSSAGPSKTGTSSAAKPTASTGSSNADTSAGHSVRNEYPFVFFMSFLSAIGAVVLFH